MSSPPPVWELDTAAARALLESFCTVSQVRAALAKSPLPPPPEDAPPPPDPELTASVDAAVAGLTDASLASRLSLSLASACAGPDVNRLLSCPHVPPAPRPSPGKLLSSLPLNALLNGLLALPLLEPGDLAALKARPSAGHATTAGGARLPRLAMEVARALRIAVAAKVESEQLAHTPARIQAMLCPELPPAEVRALKGRVRETAVLGRGTGGSARAAKLDDREQAQVYRPSRAEETGLRGDPNNLGGLQHCATCAEQTAGMWDGAGTDEEKARVLFRPRAYWARRAGAARDWCLSRWARWALEKPAWFSQDWGDPSNEELPAYLRRRGRFFAHHVPDDFIPRESLRALGAAGPRPRASEGEQRGSAFIVNRQSGDATCGDCGRVHRENIMHEGEQYRVFADEGKDRNHHGQAKNPLLSDSFNMSTSLSKDNFGATHKPGGQRGLGAGGNNLETVLQNTHSYTEMNLSTFGKTEKGATREAYKDLHKIDAFREMNMVGDALNLHPVVVQRSHELFAKFRDDREIVQKFKGIIAGCLWLAFDEIAKEGKDLLAVTAGSVRASDEGMREKTLSAHAARRNTLHTQGMAGVTLDTDVSTMFVKSADGKGGAGGEEEDDRMTQVARKPMIQWDIDDIRDWLMNAVEDVAGKHEAMLPQMRKEIERLSQDAPLGEKAFQAILWPHLGAQGWTTGSTLEGAEGRFFFGPGHSGASPGVLGKNHFRSMLGVTRFFLKTEREQNGEDGNIAPLLELEEALKKAGASTARIASLEALCRLQLDEDSLVEKAELLIDHLESGGAASQTLPKAAGTATARVADMGVLGIQYQGKDERGSGGAGGIGNNAKNVGKTKEEPGLGKDLMLMTVKRLEMVVKDKDVAAKLAAALDAMKARQKAVGKKRKGNEAAQHRANQAKRKNYLSLKMKEGN